MIKKNIIREESGFWSAVSILVLTALAALGFSTYTTVRNEGSNAVNQMQSLKADFAATSGAYMGIALYNSTQNFQPQTLSISEANVQISVAPVLGSTTEDLLTSRATYNNQQSTVQIVITKPLPPIPPPPQLDTMAIYTTGTITNVTPQDSAGNSKSWLMKQNADSIPTIRINDLIALSNTQGHTKIGNWSAPDYWCGSYWNSPGVPNVTYVQGNMSVSGSRTVYGIFVVTGTVTLNGNCNVIGVVYLPNQTSSIFHGSGSQDDSVEGGVISHGNISGTGNHVNVKNKKTYMQAFLEYLQYEQQTQTIYPEQTPVKQRIVSWRSVVNP